MAIIRPTYNTREERDAVLRPIRAEIDEIDEQIVKLKDELEDIAFNNGGIKSDGRIKEGSEDVRKEQNTRVTDIQNEIETLQRKRSGLKGTFYRVQGAGIKNYGK